MNQNFNNFQQNYVAKYRQNLIENIKILLYKTDFKIFDRLDFNNDKIYQEPLLYAFFNNKDNDNLSFELIIFGYTNKNLRPLQLEIESDEFGRVYLPNLGWIITENPNKKFILLSSKNNKLSLLHNGKKVSFNFEPIEIIANTNIELLKFPIPLLRQFYYDVDNNLINVEIASISLNQKENLAKGWNLIKQHIPEHFKLIEEVTSKCVIFNIDTYLRNSFATLSVDDIAHQTGHLIFNTLIYEVDKFIAVDKNTILEIIQLGNNTKEGRSIHVLFHALYTYYTSLICLNACLHANAFENTKKHEALGRIKFYIGKCSSDLATIERSNILKINYEELFTEEGLTLYNFIKETFILMRTKWWGVVRDFDMSNQPYNFTFSKFLELNPLR
jgi:hypothetical protein